MKPFLALRVLTPLAALFWGSGFSPACAYSSSQGKPLVYCAGGLIGGVILFFWGFVQLRTKRLMEDIPASTIRAMAPGLVEISGQAVNWELCKGPFTLQDCVYYEYLVEQYVNSGKNSHWETILKGDSKAFSFYVQDGTGTVLVKPEKSTVIVPDAYTLKTGMFSEVPPAMVEFLEQKKISLRTFFGFEKTLRFTERHFLPGETLFVMGTCEEDSSPPEVPPQGVTSNICVGKGSRSGDLFILSDESQKQLESSFASKAFFGVFVGLILIGACLWGLLVVLGFLVN